MSVNITYISIVLLVMCLKFCHSADVTKNNFYNHRAELQQSVNLARQEYVQKMCDVYNSDQSSIQDLTSKDLNHILVDHKHKLLYCYVPKVACTNWKRVLLYLSGNYNTSDVLSIPANLVHSNGVFVNLGMIQSLEERNKIMNDYTKFVMVRHPFERLLSAYRNKLQGNGTSAQYFQSRIGRYIVKNFRKNPNYESLQKGHDVTFREFCEYIISIDKNPIINKLFSKNPTLATETITKNYHMNQNIADMGTNKKKLGGDDLQNNNKFIMNHNINLLIKDKQKTKKSVKTTNSMSSKKLHVEPGNSKMISENKRNSDDDMKISTSDVNTVFVKTSTARSWNKNLNLAEIFNEHWTPAYQLCHPCLIKYNVIGKYETLRSDSHLLLSIIDSEGKVQFPSSPNYKSSTSEALARALRTLPVELLEKLYRVYEMDFRIFGYNLETLLGFELA